MESKEIEAAINKWCQVYAEGPATEYYSEQEAFSDGLIYDDEEISILRMKGESRTTVSVSPAPFVDWGPEYQLVRRIGPDQWRGVVRELAALYGPVDVEFYEDEKSTGYTLVDDIYDDVFTVDLLHRRCRC